MSVQLQDEETEVAPVPTSGIGGKQSPELDYLSQILSFFNGLFGAVEWKDADNVRRQVAEIPRMVSNDAKYQNAMKNSDKQNARIESERALNNVLFRIMSDNIDLYKFIKDNPSVEKALANEVFRLTYNTEGKPFEGKLENI